MAADDLTPKMRDLVEYALRQHAAGRAYRDRDAADSLGRSKAAVAECRRAIQRKGGWPAEVIPQPGAPGRRKGVPRGYDLEKVAYRGEVAHLRERVAILEQAIREYTTCGGRITPATLNRVYS